MFFNFHVKRWGIYTSCQKGSRFHWQKGSQNCQGFCLFPSLFWGCECLVPPKNVLGGGFKYFFIFTPKIGEDFQFDSYFSDGVGSTTNQMWDSTRSWHPFATTIGCLETLLIAPRGWGLGVCFWAVGAHDLIFLHPPKFFTWNLKRSP